MPEFKTVFGTTWKVVLSLAVIFSIGWIVYSVVGSLARSREQNAEVRRIEVENKAWDTRQDTSAERTKVPKSVWDKRVAWAVKHHCWFNGMNKDEVILALGQPTKSEAHDTYSSLFWTWQTKDCARYSGDACEEYRTEEQHIDLLGNGYVTRGMDDDCHTLTGEHQLLGLPVPRFRSREEEERHQREWVAYCKENAWNATSQTECEQELGKDWRKLIR
jgi:hypothetical protein